MPGLDFSLITYRKPRRWGNDREITRFVGVDTEAYTSGRPFLFCTSEGDAFDLSEVPARFFDSKYDECAFVVYNMQYDSGALLRNIPPVKLLTLREDGTVTHKGYRYFYIEHKYLAIQRRKVKREFWDIAQFFEMSLDKAAKRYLQSPGKNTLETKSFTPEYVKRHAAEIRAYCIQDCKLTADLAVFFAAKLKEFGVRVTRLYSSASLSFDYFKQRCSIVNVWRYWTQYPDVLKAATEAYQGGKFEVTARGSFDGIEYDIVSAYPYEIANLYDIRLARVEKSRVYNPEAVYGFYRCRIQNKTAVPMPHGVKVNNVQVFAWGEYYATLTKREYEYLTQNGVDVTILSAWHIHADTLRTPYADTVYELYKMKDYYKGKDEALYNVSKRMLNGFYGKFLQLVETPDGRLKAGAGWNPIFAAVITANTRLRVCDYQRRYPRDCIAVHTDSLTMLRPLPESELSAALGGMKREGDGKGIMIMSGMYQLGKKVKYRGFEFSGPRATWADLLSANPDALKISYPQLRVISWTQAIAWGKPDLINVFQTFDKVINLNADTKRVWERKARARDLLSGLEYSTPKLIIQGKGENPYA